MTFVKYTLIIAALLSLAFLAGCSNETTNYDSFATCLTEDGATMYGTDWCSHCQNQKRAFGDSFQYIDFVDCDTYRDECLRQGVRGYPTWIIDGELYSGEQRLSRLASFTGCELNNE